MTFEQFVAAMVAHFGADADQFVGSDMHDQYGIWDYSDGGSVAFEYNGKIVYGGESFREGNGSGEVILSDESNKDLVTLEYDAHGGVHVYWAGTDTGTYSADAAGVTAEVVKKILG